MPSPRSSCRRPRRASDRTRSWRLLSRATPSPRGHEQGCGVGQATDEAGGSEEKGSRDGHEAPAVAVGASPPEEQEATGGEDVDVDDPLEIGRRREAQLSLDRGQGHVHDVVSRTTMSWAKARTAGAAHFERVSEPAEPCSTSLVMSISSLPNQSQRLC